MINLAKVFETLGQNEKTSKSSATRYTNKLALERTDEGFVAIADVKTVLGLVSAEDSTSKYKDAAATVLADIVAGKTVAAWKEATAPTSKAKSPFIKAKVLDAVVTYATEKNLKDILGLVAKVTAELEEIANSK